MSTCFEAGPHDGITPSLLRGDRLIRRGRSSNRQDAFRSTLVEDFFWRNSEYEAEDRYFFVQQNASLIFEPDRRVWFELWTRHLQFCKVARQRREASVESCFVRSSGAIIFHRHPQVHCEGFRRQGTNLRYNV